MKPLVSDLLKHYPIITPITVQWGEMDAARHVNNIVYLRWVETARLDYFAPIHLDDFTGKAPGPILGSTSIKFIFPVTWPDQIFVGTRCREIGEDRFVLESAIVSERHERLVAINDAVIVVYDYQKLEKSRVSEKLKQDILRVEGGRIV